MGGCASGCCKTERVYYCRVGINDVIDPNQTGIFHVKFNDYSRDGASVEVMKRVVANKCKKMNGGRKIDTDKYIIMAGAVKLDYTDKLRNKLKNGQEVAFVLNHEKSGSQSPATTATSAPSQCVLS